MAGLPGLNGGGAAAAVPPTATTTMRITLTLCIRYCTSPQKSPMTYTRVNDFGPHTNWILGGDLID